MDREGGGGGGRERVRGCEEEGGEKDGGIAGRDTPE